MHVNNKNAYIFFFFNYYLCTYTYQLFVVGTYVRNLNSSSYVETSHSTHATARAAAVLSVCFLLCRFFIYDTIMIG